MNMISRRSARVCAVSALVVLVGACSGDAGQADAPAAQEGVASDTIREAGSGSRVPHGTLPPQTTAVSLEVIPAPALRALDVVSGSHQVVQTTEQWSEFRRGVVGDVPEVDFARYSVLLVRQREGAANPPWVYSDGKAVHVVLDPRSLVAVGEPAEIVVYAIPRDAGSVATVDIRPPAPHPAT